MRKKIAVVISICIASFGLAIPSYAAQENHSFNFDSYCTDTASGYDTLVIIDNGTTTTTHCTTSDGTDLITATVNVATSHSVGGNRNPGGMGYYLNELNGKSYDGSWWQLWMSGSFATTTSFGCAYPNPKIFSNWELSGCGVSSFTPGDKSVYAWKFSSGSEAPQRRWTETPTSSGGSSNSVVPVISVQPVTQNPASISKSFTGTTTLKLNLVKTYKNTNIGIFYLDSKGKEIRIGSKKTNKNGNFSFKTKRKIPVGGKILFKLGNKNLGEVVVN